MQGLMMNFPLTLDKILERAGHLFGAIEIVRRRRPGADLRAAQIENEF
jgi:hypothetical protein